ncbi:hypothetical protein PDJAM_G00263240 [Pangasius djambal]|nr:hypothetical protein [Pangasius djambal]
MCRPVRDGLNNMNGEVEKQRTEEEGGNEPSSPGDKKPERKSSSFSSSDTKPKRQDIKSDPTPLGAISKQTHTGFFYHLSRLDR